MQDMISSARVAEANVSTRTAAMCLGPEAGGRFEIRELPRKEPAADTSGPRDENRACLNELTDRGARLLKLPNGETRGYLEDGDEVILRARAARDGFRSTGLVSVVHASSLPHPGQRLDVSGLGAALTRISHVRRRRKMASYRKDEARNWARQHLRGVANVAIPSFSSDLHHLNEKGIRHDIRRELELGLPPCLCSSRPLGTSRSRRLPSLPSTRPVADLACFTSHLQAGGTRCGVGFRSARLAQFFALARRRAVVG